MHINVNKSMHKLANIFTDEMIETWMVKSIIISYDEISIHNQLDAEK